MRRIDLFDRMFEEMKRLEKDANTVGPCNALIRAYHAYHGLCYHQMSSSQGVSETTMQLLSNATGVLTKCTYPKQNASIAVYMKIHV